MRKENKNLIACVVMLLVALSCAAQGTVLQGAYTPPDEAYKNDNFKKRVIPYPHLREADVMYKKRVWQVIDLKQKFNQPFYYPQEEINNRRNLIDLIKWGLYNERITAYKPVNLDDEFRYPILTQADVDSLFYTTTIEDDYDKVTLEVIGTKEVESAIDLGKVTRFMIKEEWIVDKQRSERYVRILGIAPMIEQFKNNVSRGFAPMFWLYYPHCRDFFASDEAEVYNIFNDAQRRTYEDLFQKRYFSSYIVKEDNAFDRYIDEYSQGVNRLAESERIQQELFNLEHDLWHY